MTLVIGLTGGIGSGKSTVSNMLKEKGYTVIDADLEARLVVEKGKPAYHEIVAYFGEEVLQEDGSLNRAKLGSIIFNNEEKRMKLNSIVHPAVVKQLIEKRDEAIQNGEKLVVLDVPLLFEIKLTYLADKVLLVFVDEETQLRRLMARNNYSEEEARSRIQSQMPLKEKIKLSDAVINNNGSFDETEKQLIHILHEWKVI